MLPDLLPPRSAPAPEFAAFLSQGARPVVAIHPDANQALLAWSVADAHRLNGCPNSTPSLSIASALIRVRPPHQPADGSAWPRAILGRMAQDIALAALR